MHGSGSGLRATLQGATGECLVLAGDVLRELPNLIGNARVVVLTDATVRGLHAGRFPAGEVIELGEGEHAKSIETLSAVYERFLALALDTSAWVLGIGGGVVCDLAGFAAATWLRGIRLGLVPTTVLAQADAGIGGKNGVNFGGIKNLIGTIRQPAFVLCDPAFLSTLPRAELSNGLAEVVKAAAVRDAELFSFLEAQADALLGLDKPVLARAIEGAIQVKLGIVERDELGTGDRALLNFGHTLGHAVETTWGVRHGEAVSIGMVFAASLSVRQKRLQLRSARRLQTLLRRLGLPTSLAADAQGLLEALRRDKKRTGSTVRMALLQEIGEGIVVPVEIDELEAALANLR